MRVITLYEKEGKKWEEGGGTHDIGMIETLQDVHLTPHALLLSLDPLLRNSLQSNLTSEVLRHRICRV